MKKITLTLFLITALSLGVKAQVSNQTDVYADVDSCSAYEDFLDVTTNPNEDLAVCDPKTAFLVENSGKGISAFLREYMSKSQEGSLLYSLAESLQLVVRSFTISYENTNAFFALGVSEVQIYAAFSSGGDYERAVLYSSLLFDTKMRMLKPELKENSLILDGIESAKIRISDLLGDQFAGLDVHSSNQVLVCLLRTDNFRVPVLHILRSRRINTCLERNS